MRILAVIALLAAACGGTQTFKDQSRDALPSKDTVSMGSPKSSSATSRPGASSIEQDSTAGQHSPFFDLTAGVAVIFNGGTAGLLGLVETVTDQEPTSCDATSCTWGPGSSALDYNTFKIVVSKDGSDFDWSLSAEKKSAPGSGFVTFMSGKATPGPQRHHGSGSFSIDFDKAATLDGPHDATGKMEVTSYSNVGPAHLDVVFTGVKDDQHLGQKQNIVYSYANDTTGGGDLDFAVHNTSSGDRFKVHSRWKNGGQGRADVAGVGMGYDVSLAECWGAAPFGVTYFSSSLKAVIFPFAGPDAGDQAQCAYPTASPSAKTAP